ncbi:MAG: hypothetical protein PHY56_04115 [Candidatus Omnitrophica bacterium]|nr:hypothetical protein [Candidatus Omnitrophota bacterium]
MVEQYKSVCDNCGKKTYYEEEQQCHFFYPASRKCETCGHTETIEPVKMVRCTGTLRLIDNSQLDERFTFAYERGLRVEVTWKKGYENYGGYGSRTNGQKARFRVGKSTGWKPIYLMLLKSNSLGGSAILSAAVESVKVL